MIGLSKQQRPELGEPEPIVLDPVTKDKYVWSGRSRALPWIRASDLNQPFFVEYTLAASARPWGAIAMSAGSKKSPFPGMDPFIEANALWGDFHHALIADIHRTLAEVVPDRYVVRTQERTYVAMSAPDESEGFGLEADVTVAARRAPARRKRVPAESRAGPSMAAQPVEMRGAVLREFREGFVEVRMVRPERRLITCLEVLSPFNKRVGSDGWELYSRKRQAYLRGRANFVEIDLLRRGRRMPMIDRWPDSPFYLLVMWRQQAPRCKVWPADCTAALPEIPVPLAPPDPDVPLALQSLIDAIYARSAYALDIDYRQPIRPLLAAAEQECLDQWLAKSRRR